MMVEMLFGNSELTNGFSNLADEEMNHGPQRNTENHRCVFIARNPTAHRPPRIIVDIINLSTDQSGNHPRK